MAQDKSFPFPPFEKLTTRQGLSDNEVYQVTQDKMGFIWILTHNGLNRYDGYSFKTYDYNPLDSNSITTGYFYSLEQDARGLLWMNSQTHGIYSFNPVTGLFNNYRHEPNNTNSLADDQTTQLVIDKKGNIWIGTMNGLDKLEPATKQFTHFTAHEKRNEVISNNKVFSISIDEDDNLWLVTGSPGIDYFNTKTGKLIRHFDFGSSDNPGDDWQNHPYEVCRGKNGNMWIGSKDHGLYCYNTRTGKIMNFQHKKDDPYSMSDNGVYKTLEDHLGNLWLATDAGTIDFYEKSSGKFYHRTVSAISSVDMIEDQSQKIWITTLNGMYACDTRFKKINSILLDVSNYSFNDQSAFYFFRTSKGAMYVSYQGVRKFDESTNTLAPFEIIINGRNIFENNITWRIYEDSKNNLWFATIRGLMFYNPATRQHHWYEHKEGDESSPSASSCTDILEDSKGRYWVTTWGGGFDSFDPLTGVFKAFKADGTSNSIGTNNLSCVFEDSKGRLYIGSDGGGLLQFDADNLTFKAYWHKADDPSSISCDIVSNIKESKSGIIWICTLGGGINAFDPVTKKFRAFTTKEGLCSNSVVSIAEDKNGNYWLGTLKGFSRFSVPENPFDPGSTFSFRNYDINDGLPDNKMNYSAAYKDTGGKIYFGSTDGGIIYFDPAQLKDNDFLPPVYISDLKLFNTSIRPFNKDSILKEPIELTKQIVLSYDQNDLSLEFAALNYFHPEKNQYKYKLENYNKDWIITDAGKRFANYTNLNPGKYVFKVRASNNDGQWSPHEASLVIIITPPFWQTWWFRSLIGLTVAAIVYAVYRYRLQQVLRLQNIRNRIASDLHDDIGSTLNSISVYSEVAKNDAEQRNISLSMIGESSRKVIDAMSDIVWTINPDNDGFDRIILRMRSLAYNLFRAKNIEFVFKADESLNHLKLSLEKRRNLFLIFKETLNNLIKYSQAKRVKISLIHHGGTITLLVRDDGIGFDPSVKYNGNGLTNIRKRAKEMNAQLQIESGEGMGTNTELIFKL
jgi:Signal transduction histidine kinase